MTSPATPAAVPAAASSTAVKRKLDHAIPDDLYTPTKLTSWMWQYFKLSRSVPHYVWCSVSDCPPSKRRVARKRSNTTNAIDHLRKRHGILEPPSPSTSIAVVSIRDQLIAQSTAKQVVPCTASFRTEIDACVVQFFVANCLPFNVADSPSFIKLINQATSRSYMPPARTTLTTTTDSLYHSMVDTLMEDMRGNTVSITSDSATLDNGHSYLTVTAHYITSSMAMREVTLLVQRMSESHTGQYVSDLLDMTISAWQADGRCFAIVTDNGANFVKAAGLASVEDKLRCACHTLQLALKDGMAADPALKQLCVDAQHVVVVIRRSSLLRDELADIQADEVAAAEADAMESSDEKDPSRPLKLAMNVPTRFNSIHILFSRLQRVREAVEKICRTRAKDFDQRALTAEQWEQIAEVLMVLTPVKILCDRLEASKSPSLSLFIPLTCKLMDVLRTLCDGDAPTLKIPCCRALCEKVRLSVYTRMQKALCHNTCMLAMMLDPRVLGKGVPNYDRTIAEQLLRDSFLDFPSTLARFRGTSAPPIRHATSRRQESGDEPASKRAKCVLELDDEKSGDADSLTEVDFYLREPGIKPTDCALEWWLQKRERYPVLFEMARVYLAIPASSAPSERVFSVGGLVLNDRRRQLLESRVAKLMFLKRNMSLYNTLLSNNTNQTI